MKSASAENVADLFGSLNKPEEAPVAENENGGTEEVTTVPKEDLDAANARIVELEAQVAAGPVATPAEPAAAPAEEEQGELEKALSKMPEPLRKAFAKQAEDLRIAQENIAKERDARLDEQAIAKSKELYKSLAIEHDTIAPALRRVAIVDAEVAKAVETALAAADAQLAAGTTLTKEVGNDAPSDGAGTALESIRKAADKLIEADATLTPSKAFVKALEANPELHAAYLAEKAGK
jgi:hypothetical protein